MFLPIDRLQRECCALDDLLSKTPYCATYLAFFGSIPGEFDCLSCIWEIASFIIASWQILRISCVKIIEEDQQFCLQSSY